jgi:hypothetical protein
LVSKLLVDNTPPRAYKDKKPDRGVIEIVTNFFPVHVKHDTDITIYQYSVKIFHTRKLYQKDENGEFTRNIVDGKRIFIKREIMEDKDLFQDRVDDTSSDLTRRILTTCRDKIQQGGEDFMVR